MREENTVNFNLEKKNHNIGKKRDFPALAWGNAAEHFLPIRFPPLSPLVHLTSYCSAFNVDVDASTSLPELWHPFRAWHAIKGMERLKHPVCIRLTSRAVPGQRWWETMVG